MRRRHEVSDEEWAVVEPLLPGRWASRTWPNCTWTRRRSGPSTRRPGRAAVLVSPSECPRYLAQPSSGQVLWRGHYLHYASV